MIYAGQIINKMNNNEMYDAGLLIIMDIVHSHAVKNEVEGLSCARALIRG